MKKIALLALHILIFGYALADDVVFSSGFEDEILNEWESTLSGGMTTFERFSGDKESGDYSLKMVFNSPSQKGNLTTPKNINWEAGVTYRISFWYKGIVPSDNANSRIKPFSKDAGIGNIAISNWDSDRWAKFSIDYLCETTSSEGYVLFTFRPTDSGAGEYLFDDFLIEKIVSESNYWTNLISKDIASESSITWTQFGPGMSGNNKSAHWHPTDPDVLFIGPNMGNSYRSTDRGFTYETVYNPDAPGFRSGLRGPREFGSIDFSRQSPDVGFCTDKTMGGVFKTTDKGETWNLISGQSFGNSFVSCVAVDPGNDKVWYLGCGRIRDLSRVGFTKEKPHGEYIDANSQGKLWKSIDGGKTWVIKNSGIHPEAEIETVVVDPGNSSIVFASTTYGFYKSTDGGETWQEKNNGLDNGILRSFAMHHNNITDVLTMYVIDNPMWKASGNTVTDSVGGIFRSADRAETWEKVNGNIALDMRQWQNNYDIKKSYYQTIWYYFGLADRDEAEARFPQMPSSITQRFNTVTVDPADPDNIYLNNEYSNASTNNFKPGQVWRSKDGGKNWYVTLRNGTNWESGEDISYWTHRGNPLGTNVAMKYLNHWVNRDKYDSKGSNFTRFNADGTVLHAQMAKISFMSYDKGDTWVDIDDVETTPGTESWVGAGNSNVPGHGFYQDLRLPHKVFCAGGENSLWVTNGEGGKIRPGAQGATYRRLLEGETSLSSYAIHPHDTMVHYALFFRQASQGEFLKSLDNGQTWNSIGTPVPAPWPILGGGDQSVHQLGLMIDPDAPDYIYFYVPRSTLDIEYVGNSVTAWGIHKSADGGLTWTQPNRGLPESLDVTALTFHPENSSILFAAVQGPDGGLFRSDDRGENWTEATSAVDIAGTLGINDIHFARDGKVYITSGYKSAANDGGGLWVGDLQMQSWERIFQFPWVFRVETAYYDPNTILISTLPAYQSNWMNPGTYLSKDGGGSWMKINKGNGQSDRINDIAIDNYNPGKYYVSTYGSGWYVARDKDVVEIIPVQTIFSTMEEISILEEETYQLESVVEPVNATFNNCVYTSSKPEVARVGSGGLVTGISAGSALIKARLPYSGKEAQTVVTVKPKNVSVSDVHSNRIKIVPNPATDRIKVTYDYSHLHNAVIEIFSLDGKKLFDMDNRNNSVCNIPLNGIEKGVYMLKITADNNCIATKFVKQ